ncbi:proline-rich protein 1-like [Impatiens glandulifera]|uniref:proline-rich protein 1-like n=1 Tax=Impatiens glandulifera TaxID=253017 RepID=UPI001FB1A22A|nr:proline-rich protein 1-like [Impatiens glandulifera]
MSSCFLSIPTLCLSIFLLLVNLNVSESSSKFKTNKNAIVVGTVYCDTCFQDVFSRPTNFISGALVAVECGGRDKTEADFRQEVETDEHGEFRVQLPLYISKHLKRIKGCSINLVRSSDPYCAVASTATSSSIRLKSTKNHIFSAGFFTFKPLNQPTLCSQKPTNPFPSKFDTSFPPPLEDPSPGSFLSPLLDPILPPVLSNLPQLPLLPPLLETSKVSPEVPSEKKVGSTGNTLPDFLNPSSPPPSLFPSNPSTPPLINIPPLIPGLLPSSPSPPLFTLPLIPTFPFQPSPVFPGIPLASSSTSSTKKTSSP